MRVSREKAAENREAIVRAAGKLFRQNGFDGAGVAEITRAAGLTHGGFYGHFASKDDLAAEACAQSFAGSLRRLETRTEPPGRQVEGYVEDYLTAYHRDRSDRGCPMPVFAGDVPRQAMEIQQAFSIGVESFIGTLARDLAARRGAAKPAKRDRQRAMLVLAGLVGGMALARASAKAAPALSEEWLESLKGEIKALV